MKKEEKDLNIVKDEGKIFQETVDDLKIRRQDDATMVLFLRDSLVAQAVAAWPRIDRRLVEDIKEGDDPWDMIWYSPLEWMEAADVPKKHRKSVMKIIKTNDLVYPDGTLPSLVQLYIINLGRELLEMDPLPPAPPMKNPIGVEGQRDPDFPCEAFIPGTPEGNCEGDGHYMCVECCELDPHGANGWMIKEGETV